jgi:tRNA threonylcarbamoyladenosine biosynthesis protein TsaE
LGTPVEQPPVGNSWDYTARDESGTGALGAALGRALAGGGLVALVGPLGAGKTRLVQAIAGALGADRRMVNSPTFVLIQEYAAGISIYHFDTYRLRNVDEFLDLGVDELFASGGLCLIEWADRVAGVLPPDHLRVEIVIGGATVRHFHMSATGPKSAAILSAAQAEMKK